MEHPHITNDLDSDTVLFEFWCGERKISMRVKEVDIIKVWGPNMFTDMEDFTSSDANKIQEAFNWLSKGKE